MKRWNYTPSGKPYRFVQDWENVFRDLISRKWQKSKHSLLSRSKGRETKDHHRRKLRWLSKLQDMPSFLTMSRPRSFDFGDLFNDRLEYIKQNLTLLNVNVLKSTPHRDCHAFMLPAWRRGEAFFLEIFIIFKFNNNC